MLEELIRQLEELRAERGTAVANMEEPTALARSESRQLTEDEDTAFQTAADVVTEIDTRSEPLEARIAQLQAIDTRTETAQRSAPFEVNVNTRTDDGPYGEVRSDISRADLRSRAETALERERSVDSAAGDYAMGLVERSDGGEVIARHILATGRDEYRTAWGKVMRGDAYALTQDEQRAVAEVRSLSLTDADGGLAVPFVLDPTIVYTDAGVVDPIRQLARVETIISNKWRGINSSGIVATWTGEKKKPTPTQQTLTQPEVSPEKADAYVPYSIEIGEDWGGIESSFRVLLAMAKADLEAAAFLHGDGDEKPFGLITGLDGSASELAPGTAETFAAEDVYALDDALPARYRARAQWLADKPIYNKVRQFASSGDNHAMWERIGGGMPAQLMGYSVNEASEMTSSWDVGATADNFVLAFGDFQHYLIVDRVGMSVEHIPLVFDAATGLPSGDRAFYAHWRVGGKLLLPDAFRVLNIATTA